MKITKNYWKGKIMGNLSKLSRAFMLPISILPIAGLLLGIGGAIGANTATSSDAQEFANILKGMSGVVFANLPILFGASVAIAYTSINKIYTVFIVLIAYFVFNGVQGALIHFEKNEFKDILFFHTDKDLKYMVASNLGIQSLRTSIFGGIIIGAMTAYIMNRFSEIELPTSLSFFSGIRLVPMIIIPIASLLGIIFLVFWPWVGQIISYIGNKSASAPAGIDGLAYGMLGRSLMPFGLHHIVIGMAWQSSLGGSLTTENVTQAAQTLNVQSSTEIQQILKLLKARNNTIVGDQNIWNFLNSLPFNTIPINNSGGSMPVFEWFTSHTGTYAGRYMQDYPIYLGACIGIGLAIIFTADKDKRKKVASITGSAMAVAFLTGITEPLEFSFLFAAPLFYYLVYVPLSGIAYMLMKISGAHVGVGFARGFIDLIIYGAIPIQKGTRFWWALIYALAFGGFSFISFYLAIKKFDWKTPGRGDNEIDLINKETYKKRKQKDSIIKDIIQAYGGKDNLKSVTACATRLRVIVVDSSKVNPKQIMQLGAKGFIKKGASSQAVFGGKASIIANKINEST